MKIYENLLNFIKIYFYEILLKFLIFFSSFGTCCVFEGGKQQNVWCWFLFPFEEPDRSPCLDLHSHSVLFADLLGYRFQYHQQ